MYQPLLPISCSRRMVNDKHGISIKNIIYKNIQIIMTVSKNSDTSGMKRIAFKKTFIAMAIYNCAHQNSLRRARLLKSKYLE